MKAYSFTSKRGVHYHIFGYHEDDGTFSIDEVEVEEMKRIPGGWKIVRSRRPVTKEIENFIATKFASC